MGMSREQHDRDMERIFVGDYQRNVTHFYGLGTREDGGMADVGVQLFAFGYFTPDGFFHEGIC